MAADRRLGGRRRWVPCPGESLVSGSRAPRLLRRPWRGARCDFLASSRSRRMLPVWHDSGLGRAQSAGMAASAWPEQWPGLVELGPMRPRLSLTAAWRHGRDVCVPTTMRIRMSRGLIMHLDRTAVAVWSVNGSLLRRVKQSNYSTTPDDIYSRQIRCTVTHHTPSPLLDAHDQITPSTMQKLDIAH